MHHRSRCTQVLAGGFRERLCEALTLSEAVSGRHLLRTHDLLMLEEVSY